MGSLMTRVPRAHRFRLAPVPVLYDERGYRAMTGFGPNVSFNKFENFVDDLCNGVHDLDGTDTLEVYLSNATPSASADSVKADLAEIATGNGYSGPVDVLNTGSETSGTFTVAGTDVVITASGGAIAQLRYVVLQNTTPTSPADPLIGWWDYGSAVDLADGETFTVDFGASIFTVA